MESINSVLENINSVEDFINITKRYSTYVIICVFEHYGIRRDSDHKYEIIYYKENHEPNRFNDTVIKEKNRTVDATECVCFIINQSRSYKIKKLKKNA
jgi:hypothetical protein